MDRLPFLQRVWNNYIWLTTPIFSQKAGAVLTPSDWIRKEADSLDDEKVKKEAVTIPAVLRAIQLLSETVASLPIHIYEKKKDGSRVESNHRLSRILSSEPNKHMSSYTWRKVMINNQLLFGSGISKIIKNGNGDIIGLRPLMTENIDIKYNKEKDTYLFKYQPDRNEPEKDDIFEEDEVINLPWYTNDGVCGISPIELAAEALGVSLAQQNNQYNLANNDARPPGILINESATDEQVKTSKEAWQKANTGKNKGKTATLFGGWKYQMLSIPNDQLQFIQQREFSVTEVARIFGVPPHLLGDLSRATYSNIEHQGIEFVTYTLMGMLRNIESELERKLLTELEKKKYFIRFNVNGLLRADAKTRSELYASGIQNGWMKPNEARALEEMNNVEGGDRLFIQMNMQPLDKIDEQNNNQNV